MSEIKEGYDRVSACLYFISGLGKIDPQVLDHAARRGSATHLYCASIASGMGCPGYGEWAGKIDGYIASFELWAQGKKFLPTPDRLYSDEYMITGEIDGLYEDTDGKIVLYDLKTPERESKTWKLQLAAYNQILFENGIHPDRLEIIKLDKKGRDAKTIVHIDAWDTYVQVLNIYRSFVKNEKEPLDIDYL